MFQYRSFSEVKLTLLFTLIATFVQAQESTYPFTKEIEAIFSEWDQLETPGAAVAVVQDGKIVYKKGFGSADLEHQTPITTATKFQLRALQNQIVAFAVLLLESKGKLSLDDDIRRYLPEMTDFEKPIKIRHLLTHTHGLPDFIMLQLLSGRKMEDLKTREEALRILYGLSENVFDAGDQYAYCESGILLASEIVSKVAGISFDHFIKTQIFRPLGMVNTVFGDVEDSLIKNRSKVYSINGEAIKNESFNYYSLIDFTLYSTVEDMARWLQNFEAPIIGNSDLIKQMYIPALLNSGTSTEAVLGQFHSTYKGLRIIQQNGRAYGNTSYIAQFPDQDFGVLVLGNAFHFQAKTAALEVTDLFLEKTFTKDALEIKNDIVTEKKSINLSSAELNKFCGDYWNWESSYSRRIKLKGGKLYYHRSEGNESELAPISNNTFVLTEDPDSYTIRFEKRSGQEVMIFAVGDEYEYINEKYEPVTYNADQLSEFTGLFLCKNLKVVFDLTMLDGKVIASNNRHLGFAINPYMTDKFTSNVNYFTNLEFQRDSNGSIEGFWIRTISVGSQYFKKINI